VEQAAESIAVFPKTIIGLIDNIGLSKEIIQPKTTQFQIYVNGKMLSPPQGLRFMVPTNLEHFKQSPFFTETGKQRILNEATTPPSENKHETSLKDFVVRRFGAEMYERYAAPVYGGIFGYDARQLSVQSILPQLPKWEMEYGSITKAVQSLYPSAFSENATSNKTANYFSLKSGIHLLPKTIVENLYHTKINLNHTIQNLQKEDDKWNASILTCIFDKADIVLEEAVSGILLPVQDFSSFSAVTFSSNKWTDRINKNKVLLRLYLRDTDLLQETTATIEQKGLQALKQLVTVKNDPEKYFYHSWPKSRPLYKMGHKKITNSIKIVLQDLPNLRLVGCSYNGSGVGSIVHHAKAIAEEIATTC